MIIIGPSLLSGIGQQGFKYTKLFDGAKYHELGTVYPESDYGLIYVLPIQGHMAHIEYAKKRVKHLACMTICETETVHEDYGLIMKEFKRVAVPSEFCKRVFSRQFPKNTFYVIHAHVPDPPKEKPYTFYHIGNILDRRKNFKAILEAFVRLNEPHTRLLVKATCNKDVKLNIPRVEIINGLVSDEEMDKIHDRSDCYVSFSHSEGIGLGAVEAALRDKPVIITGYGAPSEYVKTPYVIDCELGEVGVNDFLFKKDMLWGNPNFDQLLEFMRHAYENRVREMNHAYTRKLISKENVLHEFILNVMGEENDDTSENGATHHGIFLDNQGHHQVVND